MSVVGSSSRDLAVDTGKDEGDRSSAGLDDDQVIVLLDSIALSVREDNSGVFNCRRFSLRSLDLMIRFSVKAESLSQIVEDIVEAAIGASVHVVPLSGCCIFLFDIWEIL